MAGKLFYGTSDLRELFGVSRQSVAKWVLDGAFPNHEKIGSSYAVPAADVVAFIDSKIAEHNEEIESLEQLKERVASGG